MTDNEKTTLIETEQRSKSNTKRIDKLEDQNTVIHQMATSVEVMAVEMRNMVGQMSEVKCGFSDMEAKIDTDISGVKQDVNNIGSKVDIMKNELEEVKNQDHKQKAKRWDDIKDKLVWLFVGGIGTYIVSQLISTVLVK